MKKLKIVVAPSGFKESLSAEEAAEAIEKGLLRVCSDAEIVSIPLVDGGEGFTKTLVNATNGEIHELEVTNAVGKKIESHFGFLGNAENEEKRIAVLELAAAAGLRTVPKNERNPLKTTTFGVGELIKAVLDSGAEKILIGCGDSGTNDGGVGMAQALGARFLDENGEEIGRGGENLEKLRRIDLSKLDKRLKNVQIDVACNPHNILCGTNGVARIFGPQKGASEEMVVQMEKGLNNLAEIIKRDLNFDVAKMAGSGASGGTGTGLFAILGAKLHPRFEIVMKYLNIDDALENADLVFTAEGGIDFQTPRGKIPAEVASRAKKYNIPVIVLAGIIGKEAEINYKHGIDAMFCIQQSPITLDEAFEKAVDLLTCCADNAMRTVLIGMNIEKNLNKLGRVEQTPAFVF